MDCEGQRNVETEVHEIPSKRVMYIQEVNWLEEPVNPAMFENEVWTFCCVKQQQKHLQGYFAGYNPN